MELSAKQLKILHVAEDLFAGKGYEGTSVRDIAQKADVNVAMISYYFGSKENLLQSLILYRNEKTSMLLEDLSRNSKMGPWDKIDLLVDFYVDKLLDNRNFHTIMSRQMSLVQDKEIRELLIHVKQRNSAIIKEIIRDGQRKKAFRQVDIGLTIGTIMGTISQISMSRPFYCSLMKLDPEDDIAYFKKMRPKLKTHLKSLLRSHLSFREEDSTH